MTIAIFFILLILLIFAGLPLFTCFAIVLICQMVLFDHNTSWVIPSIFYVLNSFTLLAIPFFVFAGSLMNEAKISEKIVSFAYSIVGPIKGGLGAVTVISSGIFGAITGSSAAAVSGIGMAVLPELDKHGYDRRYATALIACSGVLGQLIPPSLALVVFGMLTFTPVAAAWLGVLGAGIILILFYLFINYFMCRSMPLIKRPDKLSKIETLKKVGISMRQGMMALLMPLIILGGIYGGIFTPTEAGAVSILYALLVGVAIYRTLNIRTILSSARETVSVLGSFMFIVMFVLALSKFYTFEQVPTLIADAILGISDNKIITLLLVNLILLIVGMLMDDFSGMVIMAPLLYPLLVKELGMHPIQMGVMMAVNQGAGQLTPPVATLLYVAARVGDVPVDTFIKYTIPFFLFGNIPVVLLVTFIPDISLWLPKLVYPNMIP
jgi:tripartite ATP-independent transporter DctM subunit